MAQMQTDGMAQRTALVVEDHPLMTRAVVLALDELGITDVATAATIAAARDIATQGVRSLAVVDLRLPDGPGLELLVELRDAGWERIAVLSAADDPFTVRSAFTAGAAGYLVKSSPPDTIVTGLRTVLDGEIYADGAVAALLAQGLRGAQPIEPGELTRRELDILRLVASGAGNKEIAKALQISPLTVKSLLARAGRRLGTGDRSEMVAIVMRAGLLS